MSYEEKLLRRISAQIARDRKKAFIKDLENKVRILENEKSDLVIENKKLYRIFNTLNLQQKLASLNKSDFTLNKKVAPILNIDSSNDLKSEINIPSPPYSPTGDEHIEIFQNSELNCNAYVTLKSSELPYLKEEEIEIINKDDAHKEKLSGDISTLNDFTHKPSEGEYNNEENHTIKEKPECSFNEQLPLSDAVSFLIRDTIEYDSCYESEPFDSPRCKQQFLTVPIQDRENSFSFPSSPSFPHTFSDVLSQSSEDDSETYLMDKEIIDTYKNINTINELKDHNYITLNENITNIDQIRHDYSHLPLYDEIEKYINENYQILDNYEHNFDFNLLEEMMI
ncbi:unnamed protein product [Gordionus sp. m RMFG-2023]